MWRCVTATFGKLLKKITVSTKQPSALRGALIGATTMDIKLLKRPAPLYWGAKLINEHGEVIDEEWHFDTCDHAYEAAKDMLDAEYERRLQGT